MSGTPFFSTAIEKEATQLSSTFVTTLTFTVTFQAVTTLVEQNNRSAPILMVAVAAVVLVGIAIQDRIPQDMPALNRLTGITLTVATQFLSNLLAVAARQIFFGVASVWWVLLFSAFSVLLIDSAAKRPVKQAT